MSNWKSFDESPKCHPMLVQVSDFEVIWLENYHEVKDKKNCVWKEPIFDELPKKPPHRCMACENNKCEKYGLHHDFKDGVEIRKCEPCRKDENHLNWTHIMDRQPEHGESIIQLDSEFFGNLSIWNRDYYQNCTWDEFLKCTRENDLRDPDFYWISAKDFPFPKKNK